MELILFYSMGMYVLTLISAVHNLESVLAAHWTACSVTRKKIGPRSYGSPRSG